MRQARAQPVLAGGERVAPLKLPLESSVPRVSDAREYVSIAVCAAAVLAELLDRKHDGIWLAIALVATAFAAYAWVRARRNVGPAPAWLEIDDAGIVRVRSTTRTGPKGRTSLARWNEPFGVSVLASAASTRALLAFTTPSATRFLELRLGTPKDRDVARHLLERAVTVSDADLELAAGPTLDLLLGASAARALVAELERRDPQTLQRLYLSDAHGTPIVVERDQLAIGEKLFDLTSRVDWRVFTFQEGDAGGATLYQATTVRQGPHEVVLVCRAHAEHASWSVGRASDAPPAREARVAIDRLFMTPLRAVLEQAPRISRSDATPSRARGRFAQT
jgi:hypothetical protein